MSRISGTLGARLPARRIAPSVPTYTRIAELLNAAKMYVPRDAPGTVQDGYTLRQEINAWLDEHNPDKVGI